MFYAQSTITVISGCYTFCQHTVIVKKNWNDPLHATSKDKLKVALKALFSLQPVLPCYLCMRAIILSVLKIVCWTINPECCLCPLWSQILTDSTACPSTIPLHYNLALRDQDQWSCNSRPVITRTTAETDSTMNTGDNPRPATSTTDATQLEAPQAVSVFRRGRRRHRYY